MAGSIGYDPSGRVWGLFQTLSKNPDAFKEFQANTKGFLQDLNKVGAYDTKLKDKAISNPSAYFAEYDQFLKGRGTSLPGNNSSFYVQYENDPGYYSPTFSKTLGQWYDYKQNKWRNIGDGWGSGGFSPSAPIKQGPPTNPTNPIDPSDPVATRPSKGYSYGGENRYIETVAQNPGLGAGMGMEYLNKLLGR